MVHHSTAVDLAYVQDVRQFRIRSFQATRLAGINVAFLRVALADVNVVLGAMQGEEIQSVDDLQLGDELQIVDRQQGFAANRQQRQQVHYSAPKYYSRLIASLAIGSRKQQMQLIASSGVGVTAFAISPAASVGGQPYLLLPRIFEPAFRYCVIDICEL